MWREAGQTIVLRGLSRLVKRCDCDTLENTVA